MKRPGVEYFIGYLSQFYEVVVFTSQYAYVSFSYMTESEQLLILDPMHLL